MAILSDALRPGDLGFPASYEPLPFRDDDGGRAAAGFRGSTRDCVTRAIAIATGRPYAAVYEAFNVLAQHERPRAGRSRSSSRTGVHRRTYERYLSGLGWRWTPTMRIGSGCTTHLCVGELPADRLIARLSRHVVAVLDGVVHDTDDPTRGGDRYVYGWWAAA